MKIAILTIICVFLTGFFINEPSKEKKDSLQDKLYPNEIKGFEFFGEGKLKDLKLGNTQIIVSIAIFINYSQISQ
jgi:hypothetical protein